MKRFYLVIVLCFLSMGYVTPEPPKIEDKSTYEYLRTLRNRLNRLDVTTVNPSGSRLGNYGDMILYKDGSTFSLMINVSSPNGNSWKGINLTDI